MRQTKWSFKKLQDEALKHKSRVEFKEKSPDFYEAASDRGFLKKITLHMSSPNARISKPRKYTFEDIRIEALKYNSRGDFQNFSKGHYRAAHSRNILDQVCSHMPKHVSMAGENSPVFKWSYEKLQAEALKYNTITDFVKGSRSAYFTALDRGLLDQICTHMTRLIHTDWTHEELQQEALKYKTREEFRKGSGGAHGICGKRKILDQVCSHMKRSCGTSEAEQELLNIIKTMFYSAKKIRDLKVKIENKPYIKGFEIDIMVPELDLGIEFDGTYHHSYEYMRKDPAKNKWSKEDVNNYHEIKDAWFATKGISILHIKEADWKSNKQDCIDKCLMFLGINSEKVA